MKIKVIMFLIHFLFLNSSYAQSTLSSQIACLKELASYDGTYCNYTAAVYNSSSGRLSSYKDSKGKVQYSLEREITIDGLYGLQFISDENVIFLGIDPKSSGCLKDKKIVENQYFQCRLPLPKNIIPNFDLGDMLSISLVGQSDGTLELTNAHTYNKESSPILRAIQAKVIKLQGHVNQNIPNVEIKHLAQIKGNNETEVAKRFVTEKVQNSIKSYDRMQDFLLNYRDNKKSSKCLKTDFEHLKNNILTKLYTCQSILKNDKSLEKFIVDQLKKINDFEYPFAQDNHVESVK